MAKRRKSMMDTVTRQKSHASEAMFGENAGEIRKPRIHQTLGEASNLAETMISIENISDNTENTFRVEHLTMLIESIKLRGVLQPLVVLPLKTPEGYPSGKYEIKSGSRRFAAVNEIRRRAKEDGDHELAERFNMLPCKILPLGATEKEIEAVVVETNTTARQITVADIFRNFDIIFAKEEDGSYRYLSAGGNMTKAVTDMLAEMGFSYQKSAVNDYVRIYFAENQDIKNLLEKGLLSKRDALVMASMPVNMQNQFVRYRYSLDNAEFRKKINEYKNEKRISRSPEYINGAETITKLDRVAAQMERFRGKEHFVYSDEMQRTIIRKKISELRRQLDTLEEIVRRGELTSGGGAD